MPSAEVITSLRAELFADDIDIPEAAVRWTADELRAYFESGGLELPIPSQPSPILPPPPLPPRRAPSQPARFLCLHGGGGNKMINALQTARLKKALGLERVRFDYIEGTRVWSSEEVDPQLVKAFGAGPYYGWYGVENDVMTRVTHSGTSDYQQALFDPSVMFQYIDSEAALDRVEEHIEAHGPYDALLGFSQGAIIVTMLTARRLERAARGEATPPSWLCNVLLSGMAPRAGKYRPIPKPPVPYLAGFPVVSVIGRKDPFYDYSWLLFDIHDRLVWLEHEGGHEAPADPKVNAEVAAAVWRAMS